MLVDQDPESGTPEDDRLEILSILVEHHKGSMEVKKAPNSSFP
ncbi:hypothetical protein QZM93_30935 [Burkholderia cepacia]|nr:hypothetical protein [Burkholderia cepacia]MDN7893025.1 hypothetical protein [Burkholderia cepacia]